MATVYRIEKKFRANEWPSKGALFGEGRWNKKGFWIIYCSASVSLAKLETLANAKTLPKERMLIEITISKNAPLKKITLGMLPKNWTDIPYPKELHALTENHLKDNKYVALIVPSRQSLQESNYLLCPLHPQFSKYIKLKNILPIEFDKRLK